MKIKQNITSYQLFSLFFLNGLSLLMTTNSLIIDSSNNISDFILSAIISMILTFIMIIPVYKLYSIDINLNILDNAFDFFSHYSYIINFIYSIYFLLIFIYTLSSFNKLIVSVINLPISIDLLSFFLILSVCYCASKKLEGLVRTSTIILFIILISFIFIIISLFGMIDYTNFKPFLYNNPNSMVNGILYMLSHSFSIPAMAIILPKAKENIKISMIIWIIGIYSFVIMVIALICGSMGDFVQTQLYPLYTAVSLTKAGSFERLEAFYLGLWIMAIFIKLSFFLILIYKCVPIKIRRLTNDNFIYFLGFIIFLINIFLKKLKYDFILQDNIVALCSIIITSIVIPSILIYFKRLKIRRNKKYDI